MDMQLRRLTEFASSTLGDTPTKSVPHFSTTSSARMFDLDVP